MQVVNRGADQFTQAVRITAMTTERRQQEGAPSLGLDHQLQQHLVQVGPMLPTLAPGPVKDLCIGFPVTVIAPVDMDTGALARRKARRHAYALSGGGGHETIECHHPIVIEGIQGTTEGIIIALCGDHAR